MRAMILDEVRRFRHEVRAPQQSQHQAQQMQVPIPEGYDPRAYENPRPEETQRYQAQGSGDLNDELQGLDAQGMRRY